MSPAIAKITGYTPDEVLAMSPDEIDSQIHPEDMERLSDLRRNALGTPQGHEIVSPVEYRVKCKDGRYRWISDHYALLRGPEGRPLFSVASVRDITARKQVEETLRESEEKYRRLVEDSAEGIAIVQGFEVRFVNRALLDMFGCQSEDEMVGQPFIDFVAPESRNLMLERGQAREAGERVPSHYEFKALRKDGTEFDAEISVSPIAYQGGVARQGTIRDVTERKRAEEALRESEEKYRNLVSTINDLIFKVDVEGTVLFANPAAKAFTGYAPEETVGHNFAEYVHPDDIPELLARIQQVLSGEPLESIKGVGQESEYRMVRQDGKVIWVAVRTQPIRNPRGKIIGFSGIARDITERKQAEEALGLRVRQLTSLSQASRAVNASLELDQVLAEIVSLAGAATGGDYTSVVLMDEAGQLGRSAENLPGVLSIEHRIRDEGLTNWIMRSWQAVVVDEIGTDGAMGSPLDAESPRFANPSIVEAGIKSIASLPLLAQDRLLGVLHLYSLRPFAFHGQLSVLMAFADQAATAIVNARLFAETQAAYEQLQQTHEQLVQSAKMATIGTLAAGVAHEINNPMTGVLGFAELLLQNTAPDDPTRKDLTVIVTEARRVRGIVRNLLSFSRQTTPHREKANINQMILETLALVRQRLEKTGVILEERYAPDLPSLRLDVGQMRQVVLNLIVNAIQATSRGDTLTVSTERVGGEVAVRVTDTGEGIPAENLSRIFEPFFTTRPIGQGTGLGLSISLGIVQEHGGRIEVESQVGEGSTFTVYLPIE
jgi:PAS domain S-box-containing protein